MYPQINLDDFLRQTAGDIISILTQPQSSVVPTLQVGDETKYTPRNSKFSKQADDLPIQVQSPSLNILPLPRVSPTIQHESPKLITNDPKKVSHTSEGVTYRLR